MTNELTAKITDFGISKNVDDKSKTMKVGTSLYMVFF
jgi:serine/threonine protein kinase